MNRERAIVRREGGIDPDVAARLPAALRVRAILGVVNAAPTQPGQRTPRVEVTARGDDGEVHARVGGNRPFTLDDLP